MKDRKTQRAVRNILHNELGVTSEKVETLITEYVDKKFDKKVQDFLDSSHFEFLMKSRLDFQMKPIISEILKRELGGISVVVSLSKDKKRENQ